ncbi:Holliday junction branch migration protein RuvA [Sphingomicrobium lutaoense]|uniref:Holliday junction branch migration complex subunit RuvA n=1 Tax=Sphingomicrobium lutaoense TaxID=515949 RepID=A0A839YVI2_9SPHN|nr:Holliday junction branch migration protein RuvA [Sphingomicrobium lutaoense]MBB3763046.1 Holliday junction DNA helicase RuvA [Sphingomicrobium lutaoense]
MIARLTGKLAETGTDTCVLDVQGVGYLVHVSSRTLEAIGDVGGHVMLLTEMQVREDAMTLYGFATAAERENFGHLTSVQGVGGRVALAIQSVLTPQELAAAVANGDKAMVARANGVGPKLAQRIVNELAGKLGAPDLAGASPGAMPRGSIANDALSALAGLGFKPAEASKAVAAAQDELGKDATLDAMVRMALKKAAK